jgi:hypothetical protein
MMSDLTHASSGVMLSEAKHLGSRVRRFAEREILRLRAQNDTVFAAGLVRKSDHR